MHSRNSAVSVFMVASIVSVLILLLTSDVADAKRGCSAFGHACFGGHGKKRADSETPLTDEAQYLAGAPEEDPQVYINGRERDEEDAMIPLRTGSFPVFQKPLLQRPYNFSPFLRQWLQSYRRSQQMQQQVDNQL